jgi:hypothetical protein
MPRHATPEELRRVFCQLGPDPIELVIREEPCQCPNCQRLRQQYGDDPPQAHRVINNQIFQDVGSPTTVLVNGHSVHASWNGLEGSGYVAGEVLARAVKLAILAYPERMRNFQCGEGL